MFVPFPLGGLSEVFIRDFPYPSIYLPAGIYYADVASYLGTHGGLYRLTVSADPVTMLPLALIVLRKRPPLHAPPSSDTATPTVASLASARPLGFSPAQLQVLLGVAGVACCVAMSMPQVHIVAYCSDLGFGPARGAEMLSLMLMAGVASRLISGWISDRIGGLRTLLLGSVPGITLGSLVARSVPEKFLRGLLATTLTGVAAKLVL